MLPIAPTAAWRSGIPDGVRTLAQYKTFARRRLVDRLWESDAARRAGGLIPALLAIVVGFADVVEDLAALRIDVEIQYEDEEDCQTSFRTHVLGSEPIAVVLDRLGADRLRFLECHSITGDIASLATLTPVALLDAPPPARVVLRAPGVNLLGLNTHIAWTELGLLMRARRARVRWPPWPEWGTRCPFNDGLISNNSRGEHVGSSIQRYDNDYRNIIGFTASSPADSDSRPLTLQHGTHRAVWCNVHFLRMWSADGTAIRGPMASLPLQPARCIVAAYDEFCRVFQRAHGKPPVLPVFNLNAGAVVVDRSYCDALV